MPVSKSELERIFYPAIDEIYSNPSNQTSWVAILVHGNEEEPIWVYSCLEAWRGITDEQAIDARKKLDTFGLLSRYSKLYRKKEMEPISQLIFAESYLSKPIIFSSDDSVTSKYEVITIDLLKTLPKFAQKDFSISRLERSELHTHIKRLSKRVLEGSQDSVSLFAEELQAKLELRRSIDPEKLVHFIVWLYLHDPEGKFWIYLPYPKKLSQGSPWGGVMICQKSLPDDRRLRKYQDLTSLCFELCAYEPCFNRGKDLNFTAALERAMWISDRLFLKYQKEIEACIRNFEIPALRDRLIELESMMILKPLSWASFYQPNIRWISAFGWHTLTNDLYRIGWDFCPGRVPKTPKAWRKAGESKRRFGILAGLFQTLLNQKEIFSIGDLLFTKCDRKRPIVISYDLERDDLLSEEGMRCLDAKQDFIFMTIRSFFDPIRDKLEGIPIDEMMTADRFREDIRKHLGKFEITTLSALDGEVLSELDKLKPRITRAERSIISSQTTLYLPWLVLHDLKTRLVVYFPSVIKPDIPSGGIMIGFKRVPLPQELVSLQEYVAKIYLIRSYLLSELVPEFPEVLTEAPFARKVLSMLSDSKDIGSPLQFAYIDLDNLKIINENFGGHTAGTLALKTLVTIVKEKVSRKVDVDQWVLARYGGDEFMLAVLGVRSKDLAAVLSEIRTELKDKEKTQQRLGEELKRYKEMYGEPKDFDLTKFKEIQKLTFSAGIASSKNHPHYLELRQAADNAEGRGKKTGKDKTEFCTCGCAS
jgi:diguanylate cyclase (GGDEF)-like protein